MHMTIITNQVRLVFFFLFSFLFLLNVDEALGIPFNIVFQAATKNLLELAHSVKPICHSERLADSFGLP